MKCVDVMKINKKFEYTLEDKVRKRLKQARIDAGYKTAREFAFRNNLAISTYSLHESGIRGMSFNVIEKYAYLLKIDVKKFFC